MKFKVYFYKKFVIIGLTLKNNIKIDGLNEF